MSTIAENGYNSLIYRVAVASDRDNVLDFIRKHYYPEEAITIGNAPFKQDSADEEFSVSVIPYGASIIAVDPVENDKIVGAILAGPIEPGEADLMVDESKRCESENKKWSEILLLLAHLEENANIYERYKINKALHIHVLGVDSAYRGKSIGVNLMQKCFDAGKSLGYPLVTVDCTSIFSQRIAEKLQMENIYTLAFNDYKDSNGRQVFNPPLPNTHIKTFTKTL
ncbi:arylalkylamine N-acetyltransferase-like 2 [Sitodiplosis mosellana]|uniref:arylalkylamine N-acetyltransferase-like 2 n=1 Tax=Sitodiplosis mosellana TaxID=263140 RepID=UPI002444259B|nr:arylalkylamine N-acetyltransferase-like 2 [Sitodiplosis mosellana]XP_055311240.1 arylalkylamine N-acetyltransferase-like 2 [Sitodiplosis mosellana]